MTSFAPCVAMDVPALATWTSRPGGRKVGAVRFCKSPAPWIVRGSHTGTRKARATAFLGVILHDPTKCNALYNLAISWGSSTKLLNGKTDCFTRTLEHASYGLATILLFALLSNSTWVAPELLSSRAPKAFAQGPGHVPEWQCCGPGQLHPVLHQPHQVPQERASRPSRPLERLDPKLMANQEGRCFSIVHSVIALNISSNEYHLAKLGISGGVFGGSMQRVPDGRGERGRETRRGRFRLWATSCFEVLRGHHPGEPNAAPNLRVVRFGSGSPMHALSSLLIIQVQLRDIL